MRRSFKRSDRDPYQLPPQRPRKKSPNFREARLWLENEIRIQLQKDARAGFSRALPIQLREKWDERSVTPLASLTGEQIDELARELADHHARSGTNRYYLEIEPEAKRRRGEAA